MEPLPRLGPRPRRFDFPRLLGKVFDGIAEIDEQVEPYADAWHAHNLKAAAADGPLWVALGDSSTQGVGASSWDRSWVTSVLDNLRTTTGEAWRLVNLSMSGGRFEDVIEQQLPVLNSHLRSPDLVTCVIGSNDMMWRRGVSSVLEDATAVADRLPAGTVLSQLGGPGDRRRQINSTFSDAAESRRYHLFNIWHWPSPAGALAADRIHPSDLGYRHMAELAWSAISQLDLR